MAFATHSDVSTRLGRTLTTAQQATATAVIETVTDLICDEVDRDAEWASALDPVPKGLKELCVAKAVAVVTNPALGTVASETLGAHSVTFARSGDGAGLFLSDAEGRTARKAVYGTNSGSSSPRGFYDGVMDLREGRDVGEDPVDE